MYSIKEMTEMFQIPASTIRYYEEIGLLENVEHVDKYHRLYTDQHKYRLGAIQCFKKARLSLEDMKTFFAYEKDLEANSEKIVEMMKVQEEKTKQEMETLQAGLDHVQLKIAYYSAVSEAIKEGKEIPVYHVFAEKWHNEDLSV